MAKLDTNQAKELLTKRGSEDQTLQRARSADARTRLHTEAHTNEHFISDALFSLKQWLRSIIDQDKYNTFVSQLRLPLGTVDVTESVFSKAEKVFESDGFYVEMQFTDEGILPNATEFVEKQDSWFWRKRSFASFKSAPNSFLVVDIEDVQNGDSPNAYYNIVHVDKVIDVKVKDDDTCDYIVFEDVKDRFVVIDDLYYRVFMLDNGQYILTFEALHDIGYCPAASLCRDRITPKNWQKKNIITSSLGALDWLFILQEGQKHLEMYGVWPIFTSYEEKCDWKDDQGNECDNGRIAYYVSDGATPSQDQIRYKDCPNCTNKKIMYAGTSIEAPAPATKDDPNLLEAVKWIPAPVDTIKNVEEKINAKKQEIIYNSIGKSNDQTKEAVNELQVLSGYEDRETIFNNIVDSIEKSHRWALKTLLKARYGDKFKSLTLNYGRKHSLKTIDQQKESYQKAKDIGMPFYELEELRNNIFSTQYKNNPQQRTRVEILSHLEPLQDYTTKEAMELFSAGVIKKEDFILKNYFTNFIKRFEREVSMDLVNFQSKLPFELKIEILKEKLNEYVSEITADDVPAIGENPEGRVQNGNTEQDQDD